MSQLNLYASVEVHDKKQREYLLRQINELGGVPKTLYDDKIEIRFIGKRDTVFALADIASNYSAHSIHVWSDN